MPHFLQLLHFNVFSVWGKNILEKVQVKFRNYVVDGQKVDHKNQKSSSSPHKQVWKKHVIKS